MNAKSHWLTWTQAAEVVGCPASTIETYVRTGRIQNRPRRAHQEGTLDRSSVEEFAHWWSNELERRAQRRARRTGQSIGPPEPTGWIQASQAASMLGFAYSDHVVYLARHGRFEARKRGNRWWVRETDIHDYAAERNLWVSWLRAAEIASCSHETIRRAVAAGVIERREDHRTQASLSLASVREFAAGRTRNLS